MELNTLQLIFPVFHAHDRAIIGPGSDLKAIREFLTFYFQRMITDRGEGSGNPLKTPYYRGCTVDDFPCMITGACPTTPPKV